MPKYDYTSLSPLEFEELSRDLIQARENLILESFKQGKDSGIDFRYASTTENDIIVQAKRYKDDFKMLFTSLSKLELPKVKKLKPQRYILVTSVGLTPNNKKKIMQLFGKVIQASADVIGKDDLDNLIGLYPNVEERNFKLWFSNTTVLNKIVHSKVVNQTEFEKSEIARKLRIFVYNDSFHKALDILTKRKHVIISGSPGVGKTTLAQMLVYYWLGNGYEDFIYVSNNIDEAYKLFKASRKQIFLFDDFLGSNIIDEGLGRNEDKRILSFISQVENSKNKILILTTREYILEQAKYRYPILGGEKLVRSKIVIDLSQYTVVIRARILYNHLFFSDLPRYHLNALLANENYLNIINHKNYSPRTIDLVLNELRIWEGVKPDKFYKAFSSALDDSSKLWENVFESKISEVSRCVLVLMSASGQPLLLDDLKLSLQSLLSELNRTSLLDLWGTAFSNSINELEETFIKTEADTEGKIAIEFSNPAILDFLLEYIRARPELAEQLVRGSVFSNQFNTIFEIPRKKSWLVEVKAFKPIPIKGKLLSALKETIQNKFNSILPNSVVYKAENKKKGFTWKKREASSFSWLDEFFHIFDFKKDKAFVEMVLLKYRAIAPSKVKLNHLFSSYVNLMYILRPYTEIDISSKIIYFSRQAKTFNQIAAFSNMAQAFSKEFEEFVSTDEGTSFSKRAVPIFQREFSKTLFLALNSPTNDFWHRMIWKAEMERVCDEINFISRSLQIGIYLDSEYHKEYVRSKMREKDPNPEKVSTKSEEEERMRAIIKNMFDGMIQNA